MKFDIQKIANAIIYFVESDVQHLGKTKLMKLFFYSDKYHLQNFARPMFGDTYHKLPHGPIPTHLLNTINSLNEVKEDDYDDYKNYAEELSKYVEMKSTDRYGKASIEFVPKQQFDSKLFSRSEMEILGKIVEDFKNINATAISDLSHETPEYQETQDNDVITYDRMSHSNADYIAYWENQYKSFQSAIQVG